MNIELCAGCPLEGVSTPVDPVGYADAPYLIVADTPSKFVAASNHLLSKSALKVLGEHLKRCDFKQDEFSFVSQIRCPHEADTYTTKDKTLIQKHCRAHLLDTIAEVKPIVIIPLGAAPAKQVFGRAVKITKVQGLGEYSEEHDATIVPLLHPGQVAMYPQHAPAFASGCATLRRLIDHEFDGEAASESIRGKYRIVEDLEFLIRKKPNLVFFDTETTGLSYFMDGPDYVRDYDPEVHDKSFAPSAAILTMQFCIEPGVAYLLVWDHPENPIPLRRKAKLKDQITRLLCREGVTVAGQNLKFDCNYLYAQTGIRFKIGGDTLMLAAILDENMLSKGQDALVKHYVPECAGYADEFNATTDKSRMWEAPLGKLLNYGCGDVDTGIRLYNAMMAELEKDRRLVEHYGYVSLPGLNVFAAVETIGIRIDEEALDAFEIIMADSVAAQYAELMKEVPRSIRRQHIDKGLKFSRADFTLDILFRHKDGFRLKPKVFTKTTAKLAAEHRIPSTSSKDHLPYFYDECSFTMLLSQYVKDERLLGTSVRGFKKKYIHDGLVRPTYSLWTTVTGRSASENPNGQNFPKRSANATAYRRMFVPPPGYYVLEADLSQAELRISADMANEQVMLGIYRASGDIHKATAYIVMGVTAEQFALLPKAEQKGARQKAKAVNFGFLYGMGWRKFIGYAKTQYGAEFTEVEAQRIRTAFFNKYHALPEWHDAMRNFARTHGFVRSYSGRIRHLPMIYSEDEMVQQEAGRQAINSPVQGFGSDLGIIACGRLHEEIDPAYLAPIAFVHDAIYCYVPEKYVEWGAKTLKWYMESNDIESMFGSRMKVPIIADVSFGLNFGDTHEMEGLTLDDQFDFGKLWDEAKQEGFRGVPTQYDPPNGGLRLLSPYTTVST